MMKQKLWKKTANLFCLCKFMCFPANRFSKTAQFIRQNKTDAVFLKKRGQTGKHICFKGIRNNDHPALQSAFIRMLLNQICRNNQTVGLFHSMTLVQRKSLCFYQIQTAVVKSIRHFECSVCQMHRNVYIKTDSSLQFR